MALKGTGFLALWNDIAPARDAEYNLWHTREHVPERVSVPGILSGRRYVGEATLHRYFTLYELDSPAVLDSAPYKQLVDNPTPWSRSMRPDFRNFLRYPCATLASVGRGLGGAVTTVRFELPQGGAPLAENDTHALCRSLVESIPDLTNAHIGAADLSASFPLNAAPPPIAGGPAYVLVAEAHEVAALAKAATALGEAPLRLGAAGPRHINSYRLVFAIHEADLADAPTPLSR